MLQKRDQCAEMHVGHFFVGEVIWLFFVGEALADLRLPLFGHLL